MFSFTNILFLRLLQNMETAENDSDVDSDSTTVEYNGSDGDEDMIVEDEPIVERIDQENAIANHEADLEAQEPDTQLRASASEISNANQHDENPGKAEQSTSQTSQHKTADSKADTNSDEDDGDDGRTCPICMDIWSNTGSHRLSSLRCGHLFGHSCIMRWLQVGCSSNQRRCPQCNKKASVKDIRLHYARKLQVLDTAERDRLRQELESVQREKNRLELELARANLNQQLHLQQLAELRQKLAKLQGQACSGQCNHTTESTSQKTSQKHQHTIRLSKAQNIEICKDGGCRVLEYNPLSKLLVVSQRSTNNLFSGYGIKKIDVREFRQTQFVFLHPKPIRDIAFHPQRNNLLLSVSLDKSAKLFHASNNTVIQNYTADSPLWSCCWDANNSNYFFVGTCNGAVLHYDTRSHAEPLSRLTAPDDLSPVTALAAIPASAGRTFPRGGVLACRLNSCWAYQSHDADYEGSQLPFDGPFVSTYYDRDTDHVLISTRPSGRFPHARHILCQLPQTTQGQDHSLLCNPIHTFEGSTSQNLLSRPCLMSFQGDILVAAHKESSKTVAIWSMSSGDQVVNCPSPMPILDLCPVRVNSDLYLASLSEKWMQIYQVT